MSVYILSDAAFHDITEIATYLEQLSPAAAVRLIDKIIEQ